MLRINVVVSFLALTIAVVVSAIVATNHYEDEQNRDLRREVRESQAAYERVKELRELRLHGLSQMVAKSDVSVVLTMLHKDHHGENMGKVEAELRSKFSSAKNSKGTVKPKVYEERASFLRSEKKAFLDEFLNDLMTRAADLRGDAGALWTPEDRASFRATYEEQLVSCMAVNVQTCRHELTLLPLKELSKRIDQGTEYAITPDLLIVTDYQAIGLANPADPNYGEDTRVGEKFKVLTSVLPNKQRKKALSYAHDVVRTDHRSYFVIAHRVVDDRETTVGSVLVGVEIDEAFVQAEAKALNRNVTYISTRSNKALISSLKGLALTQLQQKLPSNKAASAAHLIETDTVVGLYVPLAGYRSKDLTGVVLSESRKDALEMVNTFQTLIPWLGVLFFLLGTMLTMLAIRSHLNALEQVDSGIHEVISGNSNYEFNFDYNDTSLSSMAQSLNLMVAVLVGRDVEERDDGESDWMQSFLDDDSRLEEAESEEPPSKQAAVAEVKPAAVEQAAPAALAKSSEVASPDAGGTAEELSGLDAELAIEPAESYYRRIYSEFTEGRKDSGDESISYVRFVEKVVRQERVLRNQLSCRMVRFRVVQRDDGPALLPVKIE
jgi:hypothetical protein